VSAVDLKTALGSLASIGIANIDVTGPAGGPWNVSLTGLPAASGQLITANAANLTGGVELDVATTVPGGGAFNEKQTVTLTGATGGTFRLTFNNGTFARTTLPLPFDATAAEVQAGLEAISSIGGVGNVQVSGPVAGPWVVEFTGALGAADQLPLTIDGTNLTGGFVNSDINVVITFTGANEVQSVSLSPVPAGGSFTLSFAGSTTGSLNFNASAAQIDSALESLPGLGAGTVNITGSGTSFAVEFVGARARKNVPMLGVNASGLSRGLPIDVTVETMAAPTNEVQTVALPSQVTGGSFTLGFKSLRVNETMKGSSGGNEMQTVALPPSSTGGTFTLSFKGSTTAPISSAASAAAVQSALRNLPSVAGANVNVTGPVGGPWTVEFTALLGNADQPMLRSDGSQLTGPFSTGALAFDATAAQVQTALESLASIGAGNVVVSSDVSMGGPWRVEFVGTLAATPLEAIMADGSNLLRSAGLTAQVEQLTAGGDGEAVLESTTVFTSLVDVEQIVISGGDGNDRLIVRGSPQLAEGIVFDAGSGRDFLELVSHDGSPLFVAPVFPDDTAATLTMDGQIIQFADVEGGVQLDANGQSGHVLLSGTEAGNEIRFVGTSTGAATFANDSQVTISLARFAADSHVTIESRQGDDTISIAPEGVTEFSHFIVNGGGPTGAGSGAAGADSIRFEGTFGDDHWVYTPSATHGDRGQNIYDLGSGNLLAIDYADIDEVGFVGLGGTDGMVVHEPQPGSTDTIFFSPSLGHAGDFDFAMGPAKTLFAASVSFDSIEMIDFNTGTGVDEFHVTSDELPGINIFPTILGGNGVSVVTFADEVATFTHDITEEDSLALELGTHRADAEVTPGLGVRIGVDLAFGRSIIFHGADADVTADVINGVISQPGYGDVVYTGMEAVSLLAGGTSNALTIDAASVGSPIVYRPRGTDSGELTSAALVEAYDFSGFGGVFTVNAGPDTDDEVVVIGGNDGDRITALAAPRTITVRNSSDAILKPVTLGASVELATINAHGADDMVFVSPDPGTGNPLRIHVDGGGSGPIDRLIVEDNGPGNLVLHQQGPDGTHGSIAVGAISPVSYENVRRVDIQPLDPVTGGTGIDGQGQIVVFHADPFSQNDSRVNPTELPDLAEHTAKPNIGLGQVTDPFGLGFNVAGDEDWYRFTAPKTGTFQFHLHFDPVGTLTNGQPGLPGDGLLRIDMYEADGTPIVRRADETDPAVQTIGVEDGRSYLLRVRGATPNSINLYDISTTDLDSIGPQVFDPDGPGPQKALHVTSQPAFNLFDVKPTQGTTPPVTSLTVHLRDLPLRFPGFLYGALDTAIASTPGHYRLVGDHSGIIPISQVVVMNAPVMAGEFAAATVELRFDFPLPDDRYTLTLSEKIVDLGGNQLDGESNAVEPQGNPSLPSGDGVSGGDFVARFTVDSRPEVGTYLGDGTWYVDLNGNGIFDPDNTDYTHRDIVWKFGTKGDVPIVGDWNGDNYDEIGILGTRNGKRVFQLDLDRNGTFDPTIDASFEFLQGGNGVPFAGNWDGDATGSDEVGTLANGKWFIDRTGLPYAPGLVSISPQVTTTTMAGVPIAGDWDADGQDNVGTFDGSQFFLDTNENFSASELTVQFPQFNFSSLTPQPMAGDWDIDGDDNIGLFVRRENGQNSGVREAGEWFLDVNTQLSGTGTIIAQFEPPPTGLPGVPNVNQDIFFNFGDERESTSLGGIVGFVGNFDPPTIDRLSPAVFKQNPNNPLDVNADGYVSPLDALLLINALNRRATGSSAGAIDARSETFLDVSGDTLLSPIDPLLVINWLNRQAEAPAVPEDRPERNDQVFAVTDRWDLDAALEFVSEETMTRRQRSRR
jgi:hypothetical protein